MQKKNVKIKIQVLLSLWDIWSSIHTHSFQTGFRNTNNLNVNTDKIIQFEFNILSSVQHIVLYWSLFHKMYILSTQNWENVCIFSRPTFCVSSVNSIYLHETESNTLTFG